MTLFYIFPWIFALFMQEPYGYLSAVGFCAAIACLITFAGGLAELMVYGRWRFLFVTAYYTILIQVFMS